MKPTEKFHSRRYPDLELSEELVAEALKMMNVHREDYFKALRKCRARPGFEYVLFERFPTEIQKKVYLLYRRGKLTWPVPLDDELSQSGPVLGTIEGTS